MDLVSVPFIVVMVCIGIVIGLQRAFLMMELEDDYDAQEAKIKALEKQIEALRQEIEKSKNEHT